MKWINATKETPPRGMNVFIKATHYRKVHRFVGFYNPENQRFHGNGGTYARKNVQWLKEYN